MHQIRIVNTTKLFNKDIFLYSLADISLSKPVSLITAAYVLLFVVLWTVPAVAIFGLAVFTSPYTFMLAVIPPVLLGIGANKPIWGGRNLFSWISVNAKYLFSPKCYADHAPKKPSETVVEYEVRMNPWVSRRADFRRALKNG